MVPRKNLKPFRVKIALPIGYGTLNIISFSICERFDQVKKKTQYCHATKRNRMEIDKNKNEDKKFRVVIIW